MKFIYIVLAIFLLSMAGCSVSEKQISVDDANSLYPLNIDEDDQQELIVTTNTSLTLYDVQDNFFLALASLDVNKSIHQVMSFQDRIIIAYGYSREHPAAPIELYSYNENLEDAKLLFSYQTPRSQITEMIPVGDRIFLTFFESKYMTQAGWLEEKGDQWIFEKLFNNRLGMFYDIDGESIVQGRPYGDEIGLDGDVTLYQDGRKVLLPSFRGVNGVKFFQADEDEFKEILISDGWHQNYGEIAEPRISMIDYAEENNTYSLENIAILTPQFTVYDMDLFTIQNKPYVLAKGDAQVDLIDLQTKDVKKLLDLPFPEHKVALIDYTSEALTLAVIEDNLTIRTFTLA